MKNKPTYAIESVDNALHLAQLLVSEGPMRVTEAASRLGVATSTAHRLLAMLVYRDFAEQGSDQLYRPGSSLRGAQASEVPTGQLRRAAQPHLQRLVDRVQESANLLVLSGSDVRFVTTIECSQVLRVGDRSGKALPAHLSSAGKAMLAHVPEEQLSAVLTDLHEVDRRAARRGITAVRRNGFAINNQRTEKGLTAVGMAVLGPGGAAEAGISLAIPSMRFHRSKVEGWVKELTACAEGIQRDLR